MKKLTGLVAITVLVLAAALFFSASVASAYDIEIRNEADYDARVWWWSSSLFHCSIGSDITIAKGQSYTFTTGAICAAKIQAQLFRPVPEHPGNWAYYGVPEVSCTGNTDGKCRTCCWNLKFRIIKSGDVYRLEKI